MSFYTRPNFEDRQQVQYSGDTITLSGKTHINTTGYLYINAPILDFTGNTSASTQYVMAGLSGYRNYGELTSLIIQPPIKLYSGTTATTTVNVTGYILGGLDAEGHVSWFPASYFLTGGTTYVYVNFTGNTSGDCITDMWVSNIHSCLPSPSPLHIQPINPDPVYIGEGGAHVAIGVQSTTPTSITQIYGENTGTYNTLTITNSVGLDHLTVTDTGQHIWDNTASLVLRTGVTITIETGPVAGYVLTSDSFGGGTWQPAPSGTGTTIVQFTGNTSASCITDLYVTNIHGCSPVNIQPTLPDDVTLVLGGGNVGINTPNPTEKLDVSGKTKTIELQVTNGAVVGYVLTSDALGNATWQPVPSGTTGTITGTTTSPYIFGPNTYDIVTLSGGNYTLSNGSLVLGGLSNVTQGNTSTIVNGQSNTITGSPKSVIINGNTHLIHNSQFGSIINGDTNTIEGPILPSTYSLIGGGSTNRITNSSNSIIGNGDNNIIDISGLPGIGNTILNGVTNLIDTSVIHSTIIGGVGNYISAAYSTIIGGSGNYTSFINTNILGSSITATSTNTTYTELLNAGASSVNSYVGHFNVNDYNAFGPMRPNYITELLTSGNTTGGTYNITIPAGWVVEDVQVYVKTTDANIFGSTIGTSGSIWDPSTPTPFSSSHNIITLFRTVTENGPHYFSSSDTLSVNFVNASAIPTTLTTGEYKVLITWWNNLELAL